MEAQTNPLGNGENALLLATSLLAAKACGDKALCQRVEQDPARYLALAGLSGVGEAAFLASFQALLAKSHRVAEQSRQAACASGDLLQKLVRGTDKNHAMMGVVPCMSR
jgi:hypothetical protein